MGSVIMLPMNSIGEPCEGKLQARFDEEVKMSGVSFAPGFFTLLYPSCQENLGIPPAGIADAIGLRAGCFAH
jgi:hypothetical protein